LEPEREPSSPARSSPSRWHLLGILVSLFAIIGSFRSKVKAPVGQAAHPINSSDDTKEETDKSEGNKPRGLYSANPDDPATKHVCCHPKKKHKRFYERWKFYALLINLLTLVAVVWYACLTRQLVITSNNTFTEARDARQPWVGIDGNTIAIAPQVSFYWSPNPTIKTPVVSVSLKYTIKNFGSSPALYEADEAFAMAYHDGLKPIAEMQNHCQMAEGLSKSGAQTSGVGEMVLPGGTKNAPIQSPQVILNPGQTQLERIWIFVCVAYQDPWNKKTHYSRYMYLTQHRDVGTGPSIQVSPLEHPGWSYIPITASILESAQAQ
jgi:hypothetical protein